MLEHAARIVGELEGETVSNRHLIVTVIYRLAKMC